MFKKLFLFFIFILLFTLFAKDPFVTAPNRGFHIAAETDVEWLKKQYKSWDSSKQGALPFTSLETLEADNVLDLNEDKNKVKALNAGVKQIKNGRVVFMTSVVGVWDRGGARATAGKGPVEIAEGLSFIETKILEAATTSAAYSQEGKAVPLVVWTGEQTDVKNKEVIQNFADNLDTKLKNFSPELREKVRAYLNGENIFIMDYALQYPTLDAKTGLPYVNPETGKQIEMGLGAGEAVPYLHRSGVMASLSKRLGKDPKDLIFVVSNIEVPVDIALAVGASELSKADMLQLHVPISETYKGGGGYVGTTSTGAKQIVALEDIAVPPELVAKKKTFNTNTGVFRGKALDANLYKNLPVPFEPKGDPKGSLQRAKASLYDASINPEVNFKIAVGEVGRDYENFKSWDEIEKNGQKTLDIMKKRWKKFIMTANKTTKKLLQKSADPCMINFLQ